MKKLIKCRIKKSIKNVKWRLNVKDTNVQLYLIHISKDCSKPSLYVKDEDANTTTFGVEDKSSSDPMGYLSIIHCCSDKILNMLYMNNSFLNNFI